MLRVAVIGSSLFSVAQAIKVQNGRIPWTLKQSVFYKIGEEHVTRYELKVDNLINVANRKFAKKEFAGRDGAKANYEKAYDLLKELEFVEQHSDCGLQSLMDYAKKAAGPMERRYDAEGWIQTEAVTSTVTSAFDAAHEEWKRKNVPMDYTATIKGHETISNLIVKRLQTINGDSPISKATKELDVFMNGETPLSPTAMSRKSVDMSTSPASSSARKLGDAHITVSA